MGWSAALDGLDDLDRDWADACSALSDGAQRGVRMGVAEGAAEARSVHRYRDRTGALTASTVGRVDVSTKGGAEGVIEATAGYASFVEEGTAAHDIRPKAGEGMKGPTQRGQSRRTKGDIGTHRTALRWTDSGGETHFARLVHHPGAPSMPFIGPAALKAERVMVREAEIAEVEAARIMDRD